MSSRIKLVVLTGAGISAESGLNTFRDSGGLWEGYNIEEVATPHAWQKDPERVLHFYNMRRDNVRNAQPNEAHRILADLEAHFEVHIITQNIDDLHERAGSSWVLHLHGEIMKMRSVHDEHQLYDCPGDIRIGDLAEDGGQLRPHVVWFEEPVPLIGHAMPHMQTADIFLLVGTSLAVYPAAGLMDFLKPHIKKYIVDKRIPPVHHYDHIIPIEQGAVQGLATVQKMLLEALKI